MATQPPASRSVGPALIGLALAALVIFVGWLAYANLFAGPKGPPRSAEGDAKKAWIAGLAKQSGGDINKLSPEDRNKLMSMTAGHGADALRHMAEQH